MPNNMHSLPNKSGIYQAGGSTIGPGAWEGGWGPKRVVSNLLLLYVYG